MGAAPSILRGLVVQPASGVLSLVGSAPTINNPNWTPIDDSQTPNWLPVAA